MRRNSCLGNAIRISFRVPVGVPPLLKNFWDARALKVALLGTSALIAASLASISPAHAACEPPVYEEDADGNLVLVDAINSGDTITCASNDPDGVLTSVSNLTVNVLAGVTVSSPDRGIELGGSTYTVNNHGTITGFGNIGVGDGIHIKGGSATVNNWGTIRGLGQDGVNMGATHTTSTVLTHTVINNVGGEIIGAEAAIRMNRPGTVVNHGTLTGATGITLRKMNAGSADNFGVINSTSHGIVVDRSNNLTVINHVGAVINSGNTWAGISIADGDNNTLINNGTINSAASGMIGSNGTNNTVTNNGTIVAARNGLSTWNASNSTFKNTGSIDAGENGVRVDSSTITIINSGSISGDGTGILLVGQADGTIINNLAGGTIVGGVVGIQILGTATNTTINNAAGASINGISGGDGVEIINNLGTIDGDVLLAGGDDTFTLDLSTGVVNGNVDGGAGNDTFAFVGLDSTVDFGILSTLLNFETATVEAGALFDLGASESAAFSGKFKALGAFSGNLLQGAELDLAGGSEFAGAAFFSLEVDSQLILRGAATFQSGNTFFNGRGSVIAGAVAVNGGTVNVESGVTFTITSGLAATGGKFINKGTLNFLGGTISGGTTDGVTITDGLENFVGSTLAIDAPVLLTGFIDNLGTMKVNNTLTLSGGLIHSLGTLELGTFGNIVLDAADVGQVEIAVGTLKKVGGLTSVIAAAVSFDLTDTIVTDGTLKLTNVVTFDDSNSIAVSAGARMEFLDRVTVNGALTITGDGSLLLGGDALIVEGVLVNESNIEWSGGLIDEVDSAFTFFNKGSMTLTNPAASYEFKGWLSNSGTFVTRTNVTLDLSTAGARLKNNSGGVYTLGGQLNNSGGGLDIFNAGTFKFDRPGGLITLATSKFDSPGTVEVLADTAVTIDRVPQLFFAAGPRGLLDGTWIVRSGGQLTLKDFASNTAFPIAFLSEKAELVLYGSGKLNNLPATSDSADFNRFLIYGILELREGAQWGAGPVHLLDATIPVENHPGGVLIIDATSAMDIEVLGVDTNTGAPESGIFISSNSSVLVDGLLKVKTLAHQAFNTNPEVRVRGSLFGSGTISVSYLDNGGISRPGTVFVEFPNSKLSGTLTINGNLINNGTVVPGFSPGILTINGNYTQTSTGSLFIELGSNVPGTGYDQLIVNGTVSLELGSQIIITMLDLDGDGEVFEPRTGDVFNFLVADDIQLAAGTTLADYLVFDNLPSGLRFEFGLVNVGGMTAFQLFAIFGIDADLLVGQTPQAQAVGGYVNQVLFNAEGTAATEDALADIAGLPDGVIIAALSDLSPEAYGGLSNAPVSQASALSDLFGARLARWRGQANKRGYGLWASGISAYASRDSDTGLGTSGSNGDTFGLMAGMDFSFGNGMIAGIMVGSAGYEQVFDAMTALNDADNTFIGGYAGWLRGRVGLGAMAYKAFGEAETRRRIAATGEWVRGEGDLDHLVLHGQASYELMAPGKWSVAPAVEMTYIDVSRGAVTETGSAGLALDVAAGGNQALFLDTTVRLTGTFETVAGATIIPELTGGYRRELLREANLVTATFVGANGAPMTVSGGNIDQGRALLGARVTARFGGGISLYFGYDGEIGSSVQDHRATAGIELSF